MSMRGEIQRKGIRGVAGVGGMGNVFKFMAAFKTPSANGRGLQRATAGEEEGGAAKEGTGKLRGK